MAAGPRLGAAIRNLPVVVQHTRRTAGTGDTLRATPGWAIPFLDRFVPAALPHRLGYVPAVTGRRTEPRWRCSTTAGLLDGSLEGHASRQRTLGANAVAGPTAEASAQGSGSCHTCASPATVQDSKERPDG